MGIRNRGNARKRLLVFKHFNTQLCCNYTEIDCAERRIADHAGTFPEPEYVLLV